jgi:hypothetical protein
MEPWRAVDAQNGGLEAQNESWRFCRLTRLPQIPTTLMKSRIRISIKVKSRIQIRINGIWILNTAPFPSSFQQLKNTQRQKSWSIFQRRLAFALLHTSRKGRGGMHFSMARNLQTIKYVHSKDARFEQYLHHNAVLAS